MRLCISHPNETVFMNFTVYRVLLCILGVFGWIGVGYEYFKSRSIYGPKPSYLQRDTVLETILNGFSKG